MYLSDLQEKDIINVNDGRKIGKIVDAKINNEGIIEYLVIDERKGLRSFMSSTSDVNIMFNQIKKIGTDAILVDIWYNKTYERDKQNE